MNIEQYIIENKMSLSDLAKKTGLSLSTISNIKNGKVRLTENTKKALNKSLGIEIEESISREFQLENEIEKMLKTQKELLIEITDLKLLLMEKDLVIKSLAYQLENVGKYKRRK